MRSNKLAETADGAVARLRFLSRHAMLKKYQQRNRLAHQVEGRRRGLTLLRCEKVAAMTDSSFRPSEPHLCGSLRCSLSGTICRRRRAYRKHNLGLYYWIRHSSNEQPDASNSTTQRGCLPRPDQVSEKISGFRNFGRTAGYGRGCGISFGDPPNLRPSSTNRLSISNF
jgi:hypothetical protein